MNRTDRLLAIVLELQSKGRQRAEDLAALFETSKRTIYRDIGALCEAGIPIVSVPGQGYSLMEGYFLPPLRFTTPEATMLLLGSDFVAQRFDAQWRAAAQLAGRKIEAVLPEERRAEVRDLQQRVRFIATDPLNDPAEQALLGLLRRAIVEQQTVRFHYHARSAAYGATAASVREADPYGLMHIAGAWYLTGYCHLRAGLRSFRLDRMHELTLLDRRFTRPPGFTIELPDKDEPRPLVIRALFDHEVARWVREARSFYVLSEEDTSDGLLVTLTVRRENEVLGWLLSWGKHVRVLEPESLRRQLVAEAEGMLRNHRWVEDPNGEDQAMTTPNRY
jgi:predicted DNA-binding transcriptional regulator YafY